MKYKPGAFIKIWFQFVHLQKTLSLSPSPLQKFPVYVSATNYSTLSQAQVGSSVKDETVEQANNSAEVLRRWGCSDDDISTVFLRRPSLRNADLSHLHSKLDLLRELGLTSNDLVKIINCRPRFLSCRINRCFDERLDYFMTLFGSREVLRQAIIRNPSLLLYDFHERIIPVIAIYEGLGVSKVDLIPMLLSRPTLIPRSSFDDEKREYIRKTRVSKDSKMYKYVVALVGVSRLETIRQKVANFENFGFSDDEIWGLFGRSPYVLTLSIEKVQRNMTFVVGTMKLPANAVLQYPFLLFNNLETVLRPRMIIAEKIREMALYPSVKGAKLFRAMRMKEKRFLAVFVSCHPQEVASELMECYRDAKAIKRLAEASKRRLRTGFPF
ncbi:hypothetical protein HS088_TW08G00843 [Tripterygium wilfordii]|uniref:Mitochondrial transcription termination factor family protein n=1 Tax=Tripterygium wilfordii TaxID=458696 RepID=A0A7J7DD79_TRIWF|nr:transcription termination factor MTERF2, chloroplastic-like [Tripterygium wilfordii]XP_038708348.1 transcription termination factor MTERF2, chloroplastic-like [Tripterygium wilfordii]XP_038708349.1 transcription termination factor MTERF2, chloroplastic-like [Tripterygium wilfordii]XP_038708350.1 transcription termination factor MTERF2, chloroplastic-like [Tripterygium wilfordii]XP_038708351.1 transcription termination factor MTERF2, chloroplastic-like [Tripterygium wilfordii]XP_038708353.1 